MIQNRRKSDLEAVQNCENNGKYEESKRTLSYEDALQEIGFGRVQIEAVIAMMLILINVFSETMGISNLIPAAECDLELNESSKGLLSSMPFSGMMLSSYMWGYLGDTKGRRFVIMWTLLFSTITTIISVFVKNFWLFLFMRFLTGIFAGGYSGVMYAYAGEFSTVKYRAAVISWISIAVGISMILMPCLAIYILPYKWQYELYSGYNFRPWRLLLCLYSVPGIIGGIWVMHLPESPKYLLSVNRNQEALEIVKWINEMNNGTGGSKHDFEILKLKPEVQVNGKSLKGISSVLTSLKNQTIPLLKPPYLVYFTACCFIQFGCFCVCGGLALFLPDILNKLKRLRMETDLDYYVCDAVHFKKNFLEVSKNTTTFNEICDDNVNPSIYTDILFLGITYFVGFLILAIIIKPSIRRYIIASSLLLSSVAGFVLPFLTSHYLIIGCFCVFSMLSCINVSLINGVACDIFPTYLRSMAVSVSLLFGRFGSTVASNIIGNTINSYCDETYYGCAVIILICCLVSFVVTK